MTPDQFAAINDKLDTIIQLLQGFQPPVKTPEEQKAEWEAFLQSDFYGDVARQIQAVQEKMLLEKEFEQSAKRLGDNNDR